jgi:hypothetical protein
MNLNLHNVVKYLLRYILVSLFCYTLFALTFFSIIITNFIPISFLEKFDRNLVLILNFTLSIICIGITTILVGGIAFDRNRSSQRPKRLNSFNYDHFFVKFVNRILRIHANPLLESEKVGALLIIENINDEKIKNKWKNKKILKSNN